MNICFITSDMYAMYAGVALTSIYENNNDLSEIDVYIISDCLSSDVKEKLESVAHRYNRAVHFIIIDSFLKELERLYGLKSYNGSSIVYTRIFLDVLLPENIHNILYFDSDVIINGSLSLLENLDMTNYVMGMVENYSFEINPDALWENERVVCCKTGKNYNDGVIYFNLDNWRNQNIHELIDKKLKSGEQFCFAEQSIINCTIPHHLIISLPPKYNGILHLWSKNEIDDLIKYFSPVCSRELLLESENNPIVIHYLGRSGRPWFKECTSRRKSDYDKYKGLSPWANTMDESYFRSNAFKEKPLIDRIKTRLIILFYHSKLLYLYKKTFGKIGLW